LATFIKAQARYLTAFIKAQDNYCLAISKAQDDYCLAISKSTGQSQFDKNYLKVQYHLANIII